MVTMRKHVETKYRFIHIIVDLPHRLKNTEFDKRLEMKFSYFGDV